MHAKALAVLTASAGLVLGMAQPARAVTQSIFAYSNPAGSCQLSIPTTNTGVRPKATGFRNEGAVSNFVICGYTKASNSSTFFKSIVLGIISMDGADHAVSCTAVTGLQGQYPPVYSSATITATANGSLSYKIWVPSDFGSGDTMIPNAYEPSVTCNLPPQVSITYLAGNYDLDVGT
ncbi:MAG: hypothetical protein QM719_03895 [Thermomonas sp.]